MKKVVKRHASSLYLPVIAMLIAGVVGSYVLTRSNAQTVTTSYVVPSCIDRSSEQLFPTLVRDSTGSCVSFLQWTLNHLKFSDATDGDLSKNYGLTETGNYDIRTFIAVVDFQRRLTAARCTAVTSKDGPKQAPAIDGTVDAATWHFLTTMSNQPGYPDASYECGPGNPLK